jgi:uncharacterized protein (TIGR02996 family)
LTTEDDFHRMLDANPDDHGTRLVFGDWLQDRDDPRAEGYRALGALERVAFANGRGWWWYRSRSMTFTNALPRDWYDLLPPIPGCNAQKLWPPEDYILPDTRRYVEDAAALAFARLPPERRAELLARAGETHAALAEGGA